MDGLVRQLGEAHWDPIPGDYRSDMDDLVPDHRRQLRLRVFQSVSGQGSQSGRRTVRHQPRGESFVHAALLRVEKRAVGDCGHPDRLGDDHLVRRCHLAECSLGRPGSRPVLRVGVDCDGDPVVNHLDELREAMNELGFDRKSHSLALAMAF